MIHRQVYIIRDRWRPSEPGDGVYITAVSRNFCQADDYCYRDLVANIKNSVYWCSYEMRPVTVHLSDGGRPGIKIKGFINQVKIKLYY